MAKLEFAILQYLEGKGVRVALKRNEHDVLERLKIRVRENVGTATVSSGYLKIVEEAIDKAFNDLIQEFKDETITIV